MRSVVSRLAGEVELERDELGDLVDDAAQVEDAAAGFRRHAPSRRRLARSTRARRAISGYCTFDRDRRAVRSVARCTCASDAAASGASSIVEEHRLERAAQLALDLRAASPANGPRRDGVVEATETTDEGLGEVVGARAHHLAELHEESRQMDAQVVQSARDAIVHALPGRGRRRPAEPLAQLEPAVGDDRGHRDGGDAEHAVDGEAAEHDQAASGSRRGERPDGRPRASRLSLTIDGHERHDGDHARRRRRWRAQASARDDRSLEQARARVEDGEHRTAPSLHPPLVPARQGPGFNPAGSI